MSNKEIEPVIPETYKLRVDIDLEDLELQILKALRKQINSIIDKLENELQVPGKNS